MNESSPTFLEEQGGILVGESERVPFSVSKSETKCADEHRDFLIDESGQTKHSKCATSTLRAKYETEPSHLRAKAECVMKKEEIKRELDASDERTSERRGREGETEKEECIVGGEMKKEEKIEEEKSISREGSSDGPGVSCELGRDHHSNSPTECGSQPETGSAWSVRNEEDEEEDGRESGSGGKTEERNEGR